MTPKACLDLPFSALVPDFLGSTTVFYAAEVDALVDWVAVLTRSAGVGEHVSARRDVASPRSGHSVGVSGLAAFSVRNQAIGVLVDQGYTLTRRGLSSTAGQPVTR